MGKDWVTYWFAIDDENSDLCGEEFFVELADATKEDAIAYAHELFPDEELTYCGRVSAIEAEMMGLDTY